MAYGDRGGRGPEWRGDEGFGSGWGNQVPRPHRLGDRDWRGVDDSYGTERYGRGGGAPYGGDLFGSSAREFALTRHDLHYSHWRDRQMAELDRDYDEYRRENQARFDREFSDWRIRRGEQRAAVGKAAEHMEVVGSDGGHVGKVDKVRGDRIVLAKNDSAAGGAHHFIPCGWIEHVDDKVVLNLPAAEARERWESEHRSRALFERVDSGSRGPHVLNRSFAGTYPDED